MTAPEAASFLFLDFFKISQPHPCTTAPLKFSRFFHFFFWTGEKPVALGNVTWWQIFNLKQTQIWPKFYKCDPAKILHNEFFARFVISQEVDLLIASRPLYIAQGNSTFATYTRFYVNWYTIYACLSVTFKLSIRSEITSWSRREIKANSRWGKKRPGKKILSKQAKKLIPFCVFFFVWEFLDKKF